MPEWREVKGWPKYEVSDEGVVRRKDTHYVPSAHVAKSTNKLVINLRDKHGVSGKNVHMVVLEAFVGEPEPYGLYKGVHINGDIHDNRLSNLRYELKDVLKPHARRDELRTLYREGVQPRLLEVISGKSRNYINAACMTGDVRFDVKCRKCSERCEKSRYRNFIEGIGPFCLPCRKGILAGVMVEARLDDW